MIKINILTALLPCCGEEIIEVSSLSSLLLLYFLLNLHALLPTLLLHLMDFFYVSFFLPIFFLSFFYFL